MTDVAELDDMYLDILSGLKSVKQALHDGSQATNTAQKYSNIALVGNVIPLSVGCQSPI